MLLLRGRPTYLDLGGAHHNQKSAARSGGRALSVLGGLAIALAEDADVDGSFEDGSGSGEPGAVSRRRRLPLAPPPVYALMPPPFMPPAAASGWRPALRLRMHSHTPLTARPFARAQSTGAVVGMAVGPVGVILAICVFVLKSCGKKEVGGSLASGAASVRRAGQAGGPATRARSSS